LRGVARCGTIREDDVGRKADYYVEQSVGHVESGFGVVFVSFEEFALRFLELF
jgi:hypothetical protein